MDLTTFLPGRKTQVKSEFYWSLVMEPGWIQAGVWKIEEAKAEVVSVSPVTPWESDEEIVGAADTALSSAVQNLPDDTPEPSKTIFGVPSSWVEGGQIKQDFLDKIKKVCTELSLTPTGFVVLPEAIANYYKSEEGAPLNAIVIGMGKENLELSVFRLGNLVGNSTIARSVSVADDVAEGLTRFATAEAFPSRIIIYDGKEGELETTRQTLIETNWEGSDKIKFLHTPKVEIFETDKKVVATCLAGAAEISGVSQVESQVYVAEEVENVGTATREITPEELGFAMGENIAPQPPPQPQPQADQPLAGVRPPVKRLNIHLPAVSLPTVKKPLLVVGIAVVMLIGILTVLYLFVPKADVTVNVAPQKLDEKASLTIDTAAAASDFSAGILTGQLISTDVSGEKTQSTTGTKLIGDTAKGTVQIQNGTDNIINLPAQTALVSAGNLKYTTVTTASVSAALSPSTPGLATVDVVASDIGADYNIAKDEVLKIGNYPKAEVDAVSSAEFSGGSSQQISAVSADDLKNLAADLKTELLAKAQTNLTATIPTGVIFPSESLIATISAQTNSAKVGDEASTVGIKLSLKVSAATVKESDIFTLASNLFTGKLPSGYVLRPDQLMVKFTPKDIKNTKYTFDVIYSANLLPQINTDEVKGKIKGKSLSVAEDYLKTIPGYVNTSISHTPRFIDQLPILAKNIQIEVAAER
jgi:hypothetical protein